MAVSFVLTRRPGLVLTLTELQPKNRLTVILRDCGDTMPTQVLALDDIKKKDMLVVRAEGVRQYTGAGETAGASLALALQDMHAGQRREVEVFIALVAEGGTGELRAGKRCARTDTQVRGARSQNC